MPTPEISGAALLAERAHSGLTPAALEPLLDARGEGGIGTAWLILPLDDEDFDPSHLEGRDVPESRLEALVDGAVPSAEELALWRAARHEAVLGGEDSDRAYPAILWRATAADGVTLYAVVLTEDGGTWADLFGPFGSPSAALADLRGRGEIRDVWWPEDAP